MSDNPALYLLYVPERTPPHEFQRLMAMHSIVWKVPDIQNRPGLTRITVHTEMSMAVREKLSDLGVTVKHNSPLYPASQEVVRAAEV